MQLTRHIPLLLFIAFACSENAVRIVPLKHRELLNLKDTTLTLSGKAGPGVKILYTGCGGLVIEMNGAGILFDPYYTGHKISRLATGIAADPANLQKVVSVTDNKLLPTQKISSVFISHSHYDHLEDLPGLLCGNYLRSGVNIFGSRSTLVTVRNFIGNSRFFDADSSVKRGAWLNAAPGMSVFIIPSMHAPHYYKFKAMGGPTKERHFRKFTDPFQKTIADHWREGSTYSYLVDLFDEQSRGRMRIFIQGSASDAPVGFPPDSMKPVDAAILCFASHEWVSHYPDSLLNHFHPRKTIFIHWENFFDDMYKANPDVVPGSDENSLIRKIQSLRYVNGTPLREYFLVQRPLTVVELR